MGTGYLIFKVYADNIAQPVENAVVVIMSADGTVTTKTNVIGETEPIAISCPDKDLSLNYETEIKPYAVCDARIERQGLTPMVIQHMQIFDGVTSEQDVIMDSEPEQNPPLVDVSIPEHTLWGDFPPKIVVDPDSQIPETMPIVLPTVRVPEYIVVHDGLPTNTSARNYLVPYADYIKNVASSEIYPTWPYECLKANIFAICSLTMSRVFTEWYYSKGFNFTITSSTQYDQKFIPGRNIFDSISAVVDQVFNYYIKIGKYDYPFFSQYNDGIRVNNPGWLSQWGSKSLADKGYKALDILKYYYGNDIVLKTAPEVAGIPTSYPGYDLKLGVCGLPVQKIQAELNVIRSSFPLIPIITSVDGKFGAGTQKAVTEFQKVFNLPATGVVDFTTWYKISYIYIAVAKMLEGRYGL